MINYRQCGNVSLLISCHFMSWNFRRLALFFFDKKNVCRPWFIAPAFVRFSFVSYSHPLPIPLAEKFFHFCLQAAKGLHWLYRKRWFTRLRRGCGEKADFWAKCELGCEGYLSGYCCDVMSELSWFETQPVYWLSCKYVTSRLEMGYGFTFFISVV